MSDRKIVEMKKYKCPTCGKYEFEEKNAHDICPYCYWENDQYDMKYLDRIGDA